MAEASWPSPGHGSPARSVTDVEFPHLAPWPSDGVFQSSSDVVYANSSGMQVHVRSGKYAIVKGHAWFSGSSEFNLTIAGNSSGSTRIDTVVLRLDRSTWDVTAAVRQGTAGAGAPTLQRDIGDTGLWELPLANVTVVNGAVSIAAGNVKTRALYQSGAVRVCSAIADIQSTLLSGDLVYETTTGRWIGWTGSTGTLLYEDTGWVDVTTDTTYWVEGAFDLAIRRVNGIVYLRGSAKRAIDKLGETDTGSHVMTIPAGYRPTASHFYPAWVSGGFMAQVRVFPSGDLQLVAHAIDGVAVDHSVYLNTSYPVG